MILGSRSAVTRALYGDEGSVPVNFAASSLDIADNGVEQRETLDLLTFETLAGTVPGDGAHRVQTCFLEVLKGRSWVRQSLRPQIEFGFPQRCVPSVVVRSPGVPSST